MVSNPTTDAAPAETGRTTLRPVPAVVDWIVAALLVLVGIATTVAGAALLVAIDRSEIREAIAEEEIRSDVLTDAELLDVTHATASWSGWGLIAVGAIVVLAAIAYAVHRRRVHRRRAAGEDVSDFVGNAMVGAIATIVLSFVPFSQVLGGTLAGYLERGSSERVLGVGAASGVLSVAPFVLLVVVVLVGVLAGLLAISEGALALVVVAALLFTLAIMGAVGAGLGAVGGWVGGKIAEDRHADDEANEPGTTT